MTRAHLISFVAMVLILIFAGITTFPFYWMLVTATTADSDMFGTVPQMFPRFGLMGIFIQIFTENAVKTWLINSLIIASGTAILTLTLAIPLGYAFSRFAFRGKTVIGFGLLATQMLPEAVLVVPLFSLFSPLGLLNSLHGLILANTAFTLPVISWILKGAFDTVPIDIEEAAVCDGCGTLSVVGRVLLPVIAPSVAASAIIAFFHGWNEYVFALTFLTDDRLKPTSVGLAGFIGEISTPIQSVMAVSVLYTLPAIVLYLLMQRFIVAGMAAGSVKG